MSRFTIFITFILFFTSFSFGQKCPDEGLGRNDKEKALNKEKNKPCVIFAGDSITPISIDSILKDGNDLNRFKLGELVSIEGYVILQKYGGSESCNCHAKDKSGWDVHLEIAKTKDANNKNAFIAEVTPKYQNRDNIDWKSFVGKKVQIFGYIFYDVEHTQNAVNTNPTGTNLWRKSIVEIHPVIAIKEIQ